MNFRINFKNLKRTTIFIAGFAFILCLSAPAFLLAQNATSGPAKTAFCNLLSGLYSKIGDRIINRDEKITEKRNQIEQRLKERWLEQDSKLTEKRAKWDENRAEHFAKLEEKAQNDSQKQAVLDFTQAVEVAIAARRAAIDKAIKDFRQGMETTRAFRQSSIDTAKSTFRNSVKTAYQKAQTDCTNNVDTATIRLNLKNDLLAAKSKYQSDLQTTERWRTTVEQLIAVRQAAIEKAIQDFKTALEKARNDFKTAMGQETLEQKCVNSGGTVKTSLCCSSVNDFPNLCLIGACGCSVENSKEVKICDCGDGKCFNGTACVAH